jgi:hypothetical protein
MEPAFMFRAIEAGRMDKPVTNRAPVTLLRDSKQGHTAASAQEQGIQIDKMELVAQKMHFWGAAGLVPLIFMACGDIGKAGLDGHVAELRADDLLDAAFLDIQHNVQIVVGEAIVVTLVMDAAFALVTPKPKPGNRLGTPTAVRVVIVAEGCF